MSFPLQRILLTVSSFTLIVLCLACGNQGNNAKPSRSTDLRSPAQYFREEQAATVTPHGKIKTETVTEVNGRIYYETEDGKTWSVTYRKRADGTYNYDTPSREN
jgi:hypothetical protein